MTAIRRLATVALICGLVAGGPHMLGDSGEIPGLRAALAKLEDTAESKVRFTYRGPEPHAEFR